MEKIDIYTNAISLETELKKIRTSPDISQKNKEQIEKYLNNCLGNGISERRAVKVGWILRGLAKMLEKDFDIATKEDILSLNTKLCGLKKSPETIKDYKMGIKKFYKWLKGNNEEFPLEVRWLKARIKMGDKKLVGNIIALEDVKQLILACDNGRDKAFIALLYESGARIGEMLNIRIGDFQFFDKYAKLCLRGKTGERRIMIVSSAPFVCNYLNAHPKRDNPESLFWLSQSPYHKWENINYIGAAKLLKRVFRKAGIKKRANPHSFRHSRATELASHLTEVQMCLYFGWVIGSGMTSVYVHANGRETDDAMLRMHGLKKPEDGVPKNQPLECPICKTINEFTNSFCKNCGKALTLKVAMDTEEQINRETNKAFELLREIAKSPELLKEFEKFRKQF